MAIKIIDAIKQKHILSLVDKTVEKGNLMSFYHIINTRNLDIHSPEILSRLNKIMKNKAFTINSTDFVALDRLKLDAETILNNPELRTTFINYYTGELLSEVDIFYMDIVRHVELFKQLIKDETFKAELCTRVDITKVGDRFFGEDAYLRYLEPEIRGTLTDNIEILRSLGYKFEKEKMKKLMLRSESNQQILLMLGLVDQKDIGDLYKYKFEVLKEWFKNGSPEPMPNIPIDHYIYKETPDNPMANYWNKLSRKLSFDPMEFVFRIIKRFDGLDIFSEGKTSELYEKWHEENPYWTKKEFYSKLDENLGRIFTKDGILTDSFFASNNYKLDMLHEVLYYNWEDHANSRYYGTTFPSEQIEFLIAEKDKVPAQYRFIFEKLEELSKIEDYYERKAAQEEFLKIVTGGHYIQESSRLFDEHGFNERFYEAILYIKGLSHLDQIEPKWKEHFNKTELLYIEKYREILPTYILSDIYTEERYQYNRNNDSKLDEEELEEKLPSSLSTRELINRYFNEKGFTRTAIVALLGNLGRRALLFDLDEVTMLDEEKAFLAFLKKYHNPPEINIPVNEIKKYFDSKGPRDQLAVLLYSQFNFEIILECELNYQNILKPKDIKIMDEYKKVEDYGLRKIFLDFIKNHKDEITEDKVELLSTVLQRLSKSNSTEVLNLRTQLALQLLATEEPLKNLDSIEQIFLKNNLPTVGKIYSVFSILHPNFMGFDLTSDYSMISPTLKSKGNRSREMIIFSDLLRAAMGSNNRSVLSYLKTIRQGNELYLRMKKGDKELTPEEEQIIIQFIKHLLTLYQNTLKGKKDKKDYTISGDYIKDIEELMTLLSPDGTLDFNIADRVISMFCHFAGITSLEEAEEYMRQTKEKAEARNRSITRLTLRQGDFVKGIGDITYLGHILQNGSVSKEYLGAYSSSDATPLDTDLSMVLHEGSTIGETIEKTAARGYGPIWFILKNDDRFAFTRRSGADPDQTIEEKPPISKLEAFYTGVLGEGHYGIRTGFASSEINAIVVQSYDKRIGLEIALNGFYIPVFNKTGELVFSYEDYKAIRENMRGLKYYSAEEYIPSQELLVPGVKEMAALIPGSIEDTMKKRKAINETIQKALQPFGITVKNHYDGDLTEGTAELIDTGSTGRFTNMPGSGDFDFMLKLDRRIKEDPQKMDAIRHALLVALNKENHTADEVIGTGDFRLKDVHLDNLDVPVEIDISFETKTDKVAYSTDESLKDRLSSIKESHPQEYLLIISNILLAKKVLKEAEVYKPNKGANPQGGLGGVGIENWILQHGGSFKQAAESFLSVAKGKDFEAFKHSYVIWDFGENHMITRNNIYPHDDFVYNMSKEGYDKMKKALAAYLKTIGAYRIEFDDPVEEETEDVSTGLGL